jgi:hypothetical protein
METQFNINLHHENLYSELFEWYQCQPFMVLNKIHNVDLFNESEETLDQLLDELREEWHEMELEYRVDLYNEHKDFKY